MAAENRRQHYVPQFYLERFVDQSGYLWVYEVGRACRKSLPREVAHQRDYYALKNNDERNNTVDDYLSQSETSAGKVLPRLTGCEEISETDWSDLCRFIGLLFARVPSTRKFADRAYGEVATDKFLAAMDDNQKFAELFERSKHRIAGAETADQLRRMLQTGYRLEQHSQYHNLVTMLDIAEAAIDCVSKLAWEITTTDNDQQFITGDNPVVTVTPDGHGWAKYGEWFDTPDIRVLFPLSPLVCLVLRERSSARRHRLGPKQVRCINSAIMCLADRFIYASEPSKGLSRAFDKKGCQSEYTDGSFVKIRPEWLV